MYATKFICRNFEFYVDTSSHEIVELGTINYPYKSMRSVFAEILNVFSHKNVNITILLRENAYSFLSDDISYIINISSVKITSYSLNMTAPEKATLIPTQIQLPVTNLKTSFHILRHMDLNLDGAIQDKGFYESQIFSITRKKTTFIVVMSSLFFDNLNIRRELVDKLEATTFTYLINLQTHSIDVRNVNFNLTGHTFESYDPLNVHFENIQVGTSTLMGFTNFFVFCNYPGAAVNGLFYANNITVYSPPARANEFQPCIF